MGNMTDILNYISTWSALKWVVIVLVAGFIGQFGKMLAQSIVRKISLARLKKQSGSIIEPTATGEDHELPASDRQKDIKTELNLPETHPDKKALKIMAKERKKASKKSK
jgi:hypothetical protein